MNHTTWRQILAVMLALGVAGIVGMSVSMSVSSQSIPPPRYPVISDMLALEQRIDALERDNAELRENLQEARGQIGVLQLLRAHDTELSRLTRAEDQKRIAAMEWVIAGQRWLLCDR